MAQRWRVGARNQALAKEIADALRVDPVVGHLLINRGVTSEDQARRFLDRKLQGLHDPALLSGASEAAERIHAAIKSNKSICIYGDYDVDGMCATAILLEVIRIAGVQPRFYVPDRMEEGYGLNSDALRKLKEQGVDLVVTVDCGISSVKEAEVAREIGLELIITDHHEFGERLPDAQVLVHPRLPGSKYPFGDLCGTVVAFKLAWELARKISGSTKTEERFRNFLLGATSLSAIGTVCDIVPMLDENRVLCHHGMLGLTATPSLGLQHLMEIAGLKGKKQLTSGDLGFMIGPRLNACGRLGQARLGVELLTTKDSARAAELAAYMEDQNGVRQTIERKIFADAKERAQKEYRLDDREDYSPIVLASDEWHPGVIGIVASRMVERFHRPCILISFNGENGTGSGRSIPGFHLQETLLECLSLVNNAGGHAMAAGVRLSRSQLEGFREAFCANATKRLREGNLVSELAIDTEVPLGVLTPKLVKLIEIMEPFGHSNPVPTMMASNLQVVGEPKKMGGGERHVAFRVKQGGSMMRAVAFNMAERIPELMSRQGECCLAFQPVINEFRGFAQVELKVKDFKAGRTLEDSALMEAMIPAAV